MKYIVTRSNGYPNDNPKCPGAQKEIIPLKGELTEAYTVEISSLEELHQLISKVGHPIIVFTKSNWGFDNPELEIYDTCRE
jgi:hypothetical protein